MGLEIGRHRSQAADNYHAVCHPASMQMKVPQLLGGPSGRSWQVLEEEIVPPLSFKG